MSDGKKLALLLRSLLELEVVREAVTDPELRADLRALALAEEEPLRLSEAAARAGTNANTVRGWWKRDPQFRAAGILTRRGSHWYAVPSALRRWAEGRGGSREPRASAPRRRAAALAVLN